jgi:hypothetical protein
MNEEQLREIETAERAATAGPWTCKGPVLPTTGNVDIWGADGICVGIAWHYRLVNENARFIANARTWVPQLLAEIRRLNEMLLQNHATIGDLENQLEGLRQQQCQQLHEEQEERP